ncbi:alpha/beta fold hydrolase [Luteibacter sp.]|uniref:alpha/beta fold hydrolase n=1 Tax=Luteibacter sp. TaxID=1886636 RepID=UPI002F408E69
MGTLQHVQDMERARLSLGEPSLNFLGYSYGAWTGAFYAATYPEHAGRMVLDSPGNFTGSFEDQLDDQSHDFQTLFTQRALLPAVADPDYGIDADTALQRLREMPYQVRKAWAWAIGTPAELVAALAMSDWFRAEPHVDLNHWVRRIVQHRFHAKEEVNDTIRDAALGLAYITRESTELAAGINPYVYYGLVCGDTPWRKHLDSLRSMAMSHAVLYPAAASDHINTGAVCHHWRSSARWRPPLTELAKAPPLLIIQAEFDPVASLRSTNNAFVASPGAFMIVAEGMYGHGVFGMSHTYCVERGVGVYFLRGEVPYARFSKCEFRAQTPSRIHGASQPGISEVRARLKEILRRS